MSYSYIKSVFPDFKPSQIENIYNVYSNSKPPITNKPESAKAPVLAYNEEELTQFVKDLIQKSSSVPVSGGGSGGSSSSNESKIIPKDRDNLHYYNPKVPMEYISKFAVSNQPKLQSNLIQEQNNNVSLEKFSETEINTTNCNGCMNHILDCEQCKKIIMKQLNLDASRRQYEEIIEVITYILFGIFVLIVLENLKV